jgi:uncharacterized protein DUF955
MPKKVPYLREEQIERDAAALLAEYERESGVRIARAVPIEDIVEKHLKLGIEFDDMHRLFKHPRSGFGFEPDILGAISFDSRRIVIDESLDPEENPSKEGRYRFTLAHEGGGHWRLHRHLFAKDPAQISLFNESSSASVVCRSRQAKDPIEWQADFYASCLLMPRTLVMAAWEQMFPDCKPRVLQPETPIGHPYVEIERMTDEFGNSIGAGADDCVLENFARPLAEQFLVSPIAMRIRLEKLGLLLREAPQQRTLR